MKLLGLAFVEAAERMVGDRIPSDLREDFILFLIDCGGSADRELGERDGARVLTEDDNKVAIPGEGLDDGARMAKAVREQL